MLEKTGKLGAETSLPSERTKKAIHLRICSVDMATRKKEYDIQIRKNYTPGLSTTTKKKIQRNV